MSSRTCHPPDLLQVSVHASDRRHILVLEGELDLASAPFLTSAFDAVLPHANAVILDLDRLSFIDSTGLLEVLACEEKCRRHSIGFAVTDASPPVRRLFQLTGVAPRLPGALCEATSRRSRRDAVRGHLEASVIAEARRLRHERHAPSRF